MTTAPTLNRDTFLTPPDSFNLVVPGIQYLFIEGIYRSLSLLPVHFPFLKTLNLKTILSLNSNEQPSKSLQQFNQQQNIQFISLSLEQPQQPVHHFSHPSDQPSYSAYEDFLKQALEFILNQENMPILILCAQTPSPLSCEGGVLIALLRRWLGWHLGAAVEEYRRFAGGKRRYASELIVEIFDLDLIRVDQKKLSPWFQQIGSIEDL